MRVNTVRYNKIILKKVHITNTVQSMNIYYKSIDELILIRTLHLNISKYNESVSFEKLVKNQ